MEDNEIIKALAEHIKRTENIKYGARKMTMVDVERLKEALDLITRQKEEITKNENIIEAAENLIDSLKKEIESLIAGQETLQKYIAEKDAEVKELKERDETAEKIIREQGGTILQLKDENCRLFDRNCELSEKGENAVIACIAAKSEAVKEFAERLKEKFTHVEYVINSSRKTIPIQTVKAEVDAILQNGCSNIIDSVRKEMVVD